MPGRYALVARNAMLLWRVEWAAVRPNSLVAKEASFLAVTAYGGAVVAFGSNANGGNVVRVASSNMRTL